MSSHRILVTVALTSVVLLILVLQGTQFQVQAPARTIFAEQVSSSSSSLARPHGDWENAPQCVNTSDPTAKASGNLPSAPPAKSATPVDGRSGLLDGCNSAAPNLPLLRSSNSMHPYPADRDAYDANLRCIGALFDRSTFHGGQERWSQRLRSDPNYNVTPPVFMPQHGMVSPLHMLRQAVFIAGLILVPDVCTAVTLGRHAAAGRDGAGADSQTVIVELGAGNGGLLFGMCPPVAQVACFGVDFSEALVRHGTAHFPHIHLRVGIDAPHLANGTADAVISHGVMLCLTPAQACAHVAEGLRLLRPRGVLAIWTVRTLWFGTRFHPSFFTGPVGGVERSLPFCGRDVARLAATVTVIDKGTRAAIYPANRAETGWFGVTIERSADGAVHRPLSPVQVEAHKRSIQGEAARYERTVFTASHAVLVKRFGRRMWGHPNSLIRRRGIWLP